MYLRAQTPGKCQRRPLSSAHSGTEHVVSWESLPRGYPGCHAKGPNLPKCTTNLNNLSLTHLRIYDFGVALLSSFLPVSTGVGCCLAVLSDLRRTLSSCHFQKSLMSSGFSGSRHGCSTMPGASLGHRLRCHQRMHVLSNRSKGLLCCVQAACVQSSPRSRPRRTGVQSSCEKGS